MLGGQVIERQGLVDAAQQPIQRHLDRFGVEVHVAAYLPGAVFYAYRKRASTRVATINRTGRRWAIHASGCGRAVLATMSQAARNAELGPLLTAEEQESLEEELTGWERFGYIVTDVSQPGIRSVASPVFDSTNLAMGAIGIGDTAASMNRTRVQELGAAVRQAAIETSRAMGWTGTARELR
nr:IclR family transcriptional regulator C-terminal domain-containing protein [Tessaracoccus sp. MC1756]